MKFLRLPLPVSADEGVLLMVFRCEVRPVIKDADKWSMLLFGRAGPRARRLSRLRGSRLAQSLSAEALCMELTGELLPGRAVNLEEDSSGKPYLPGCPLSVSLSHSGGYVAAAVAETRVGIDLQALRGISDRVLRRFYSQEEQSWIRAGDRTRRAIRLWTMKEAYAKLRGDGIFGGAQFCALFAGDRPETEYEDVRFLFPDAPDGLLFTVCLERQAES